MYSETNDYNADGGNDCLDLWGNYQAGYCLTACAKIRGTVCPHVKIYGVLFVRGTICPVPVYPLSSMELHFSFPMIDNFNKTEADILSKAGYALLGLFLFSELVDDDMTLKTVRSRKSNNQTIMIDDMVD